MAGIWGTMVYPIAHKSGHKINKAFAAKLASRVLAGVALYVTGSKLAIYALHFILGVGTIGAMGINSFLNALYTYRMGKACTKLFDKSGAGRSLGVKVSDDILGLIIGLPKLREVKQIVGGVYNI